MNCYHGFSDPRDCAICMQLDIERVLEIENSHAWLYVCFGPGKRVTCTLCGARKADPNLKACPSAAGLGRIVDRAVERLENGPPERQRVMRTT